MRQLHPVSFHEKFVASGVYVFEHDGVPTGDVEHWTMHEPGPGSLTIRSDRDGCEGSGRNWIFEGLWIEDSHGGHLERFDLEVIGPNNRQTQAKFVFNAGELQFSARVGASAQPIEMLLLPPNTVVRPPSLAVEYRFALRFLALSLGEMPVYAPVLHSREGTIGVGHAHIWRVEDVGTSETLIEGVRYPVRVFHLTDKTKNRHATVAFDEHGVLLSVEREYQHERAVLTRYVRRPEPAP